LFEHVKMEMTSPVHRYKGPCPGVSAVGVQITVFCVALFVFFERYAGQVKAFGNNTDVVVGPVVGLADGGR
jgi:hypothetical protein